MDKLAPNNCAFKALSLSWMFFAVVLVGCDSKAPTQSSSTSVKPVKYPIAAVATVGMVADLVRNVGGEHVVVTQVMGSGVDPHLYTPNRDDVQTIMSGDIVFYSGLMLEGKMTDTLEKISRNKRVFEVTKLIDKSYLLSPEDNPAHHDPHVWMDVAAWSQCVEGVANALAHFDPKFEADYRTNAAEYRRQLALLDGYGKQSIGTIPSTSRVLITSHDAFSYFGRAYGLEVLGIQGLSTESEGGIQRTNELVDLIVSRNVQAVFVESSVPRKNILSLIDGANSRGHHVNIGGELFSDAMGSADTYEGTYIGMLDHNITLVTKALGGSVPDRGLNGKLSLQRNELYR